VSQWAAVTAWRIAGAEFLLESSCLSRRIEIPPPRYEPRQLGWYFAADFAWTPEESVAHRNRAGHVRVPRVD